MSKSLLTSDFQAASQAAACDRGMTKVLMNACNGNTIKMMLEEWGEAVVLNVVNRKRSRHKGIFRSAVLIPVSIL